MCIWQVERRGQKKYLKNNVGPKCDEAHQSTDPRGSLKTTNTTPRHIVTKLLKTKANSGEKTTIKHGNGKNNNI